MIEYQNPFIYFHKIYNKTTNPKLTLEELLTDKDIYISSILHSIFYSFSIVFLEKYFLCRSSSSKP